jgi:hypothetical protein
MRLTLATWNLARPFKPGARRNSLIADHMGRVAADVWILTETHDSITPWPDLGGVSTNGSDRPSAPGERWVTLWTRFPLEPLPTTSDPVRSVAARIFPPQSVPLIVYGTVLPWLGSKWRGISSVDGEAFAAALETQASDWRALTNAYPDHDLVVAGDFNQDLANSHYYGSRANRQRLRDALERAGLLALTAGEKDPVRAQSAPLACIDHICLSAGSRWRPTATYRWPDHPKPDRRLSDHFGIAVSLEA